MSKGFNKILDFMKLNDNEYNDYEEYEGEMDEESSYDDANADASDKKKKSFKASSKPKKSTVLDDYDAFDEEDSFSKKKSSTSGFGRKSSTVRNSSNIVPLRSPATSSRSMEVCITRPKNFDSCQEISDLILSGKAAIINFEGVTTQEAQRIIDFVSGACYAIKGSASQISEKIVVVTPEDIDITGDLQNMVGSNVDMPSFSYPREDD